ncbi:MAG TPA: HAMP domain-containing sensor histidine kinase [Polyangiaceae bacterium]|nr:HAMP domain-containing sensor histidine kinase [Polyangiaceae bacterium]
MSGPSTQLLPREKRRFSLRLRVMAAIVIAAVAPELLVFLWTQVDRDVPGHMGATVRDAARDATNLLVGVVASAKGEFPEEALIRMAGARKVRLRILDDQAATLFDVDADAPGDPFNRVESFFLSAGDAPTMRDFDAQLGPMLARPEVILAKRAGSYTACDYLPIVLCQSIAVARGERTYLVHVQMSSRRAVSEVYALRSHLLRLSLIILPLAFVLAFYTGRRVVRPIERLREQALAKATAENPSATLRLERRDEVGVLADAFNVLLVALEKKRADNEAFVADLVHELKNPVAAVRAAADTLGESAVDPERAARLSRVLRDSTNKLDRLVTQFLELARAEAGMPNEERSEVDLAALTQGLVNSLRDDPRHAGITFVLKELEAAHGKAVVRGVAHRLDALFRELLENAASFAGEGGRVAAILGVTSAEVVVAIRDTGPGIASEDLPRVFTRFFTTRGRQRGTGLGLSLVKAVAEAHGGRVTVSLGAAAAEEPSDASAAKAEWTTFEVRLPRWVR